MSYISAARPSTSVVTEPQPTPHGFAKKKAFPLSEGSAITPSIQHSQGEHATTAGNRALARPPSRRRHTHQLRVVGHVGLERGGEAARALTQRRLVQKCKADGYILGLELVAASDGVTEPGNEEGGDRSSLPCMRPYCSSAVAAQGRAAAAANAAVMAGRGRREILR